MDDEIRQSPEVNRQSIRDILREELKREFVERRIAVGNRWPESEADGLRCVLNDKDKSEEEAADAVLGSRIYKEWKEISERNFSGEDLAMVASFAKFLRGDEGGGARPELFVALEEVLYELKEARMRALGVSEEAIVEDRAHTKAVAENMPDEMGKIMAILHDVSKYSAVQEDGGVRQVRNVGIHEATSAILAGKILRGALLGGKTLDWLDSVYGHEWVSGYRVMANKAIGFMESAIAAHGCQEFPMKVSKGRPLAGAKGAYVYQPVSVMPKEVYLGEYRALRERIVGDVMRRILIRARCTMRA